MALLPPVVHQTAARVIEAAAPDRVTKPILAALAASARGCFSTAALTRAQSHPE